MVQGNPLIEQIRERSGDPDAVVDALLDELRLVPGVAGGHLDLQVLVFSAARPRT